MDDRNMSSNAENSVENSELVGIVSNVQRFTVHDGPGIRTEFFLKGCPLRCRWCSNPETYERAPQIGVNSKRCIGCGYCLKVCAEHGKNALIIGENKIVGIDRSLCDNCLLCYEECFSDTLNLWGEKMSVEQSMAVIRKDRNFYERSGGGVTLSGGEPLLQPDYCQALLKACKKEGIHTCVESALHVNPSAIDKVAPYTDLYITDIKQMDSEIHKKYTNVGNELILSNIKKLIDMDAALVIRMPIIPGFNDNDEYIERTSAFILNELSNKPKQVQLLRYRPLGEEKANMLSLPHEMKAIKIEDQEGFERKIIGYVQKMKDMGIAATAGSREKRIE